MKQEGQQRLHLVPVYLKEANEFIAKHHRHHKPVKFHIFSLGVVDEEKVLRGVCVVMRPCARHLVDGVSLEVCRLATDGCPNTCSFLYAAAWRATKALGYTRLITYILESEPGDSLKASGWKQSEGLFGGKSWSSKSRLRVDKAPTTKKKRWYIGEDFV